MVDSVALCIGPALGELVARILTRTSSALLEHGHIDGGGGDHIGGGGDHIDGGGDDIGDDHDNVVVARIETAPLVITVKKQR